MGNDDILSLLRKRGSLAFEGEAMTPFQHGWQCSSLASQGGASDSLRLAAWLHDLGHLLSPLSGPAMHVLRDDRHEVVAGRLLCTLFGDAVGMPVLMHVQAKRYLLAVHPVYRERLSAGSRYSLALQGGPMSEEEALHYRSLPFADDALRLRTWDDIGKLAHWHPENREAALRALADLMERVQSTQAQSA